MCIRDRFNTIKKEKIIAQNFMFASNNGMIVNSMFIKENSCLLYTSDAADERSSVDLGGRRIIKKKKSIIINASDINHKKQ